MASIETWLVTSSFTPIALEPIAEATLAAPSSLRSATTIFRAFPSVALGDRFADAAGRACNDGDFVVQFHG